MVGKPGVRHGARLLPALTGAGRSRYDQGAGKESSVMFLKGSRTVIRRLAAPSAVVLALLVVPSGPAAASGWYRAVDLGFGG
ncbi:hypothetical protein GCM10020358_81660 [Amorphoplanes nipponensis]